MKDLLDQKYGGDSAIGADMFDLYEISAWYMQFLHAAEGREFSIEELEELAGELSVQMTMHLGYHFRSLRREINRVLEWNRSPPTGRTRRTGQTKRG